MTMETVTDLLDRRIAGVSEWLKDNRPECFSEQRHLDEGARERAYWHYGYLVALRDVRKLFPTPATVTGLPT